MLIGEKKLFDFYCVLQSW